MIQPFWHTFRQTTLKHPAPLALQGAANSPLIQIRAVTKSYENNGQRFLALKGIDLEVLAGEFVAITGKSGAGKTTLTNVLTGVDHVSSGEIWVGGVPIHRLKENQLAAWRGRNVGVIYQSFHLMPTLTLLDNVLMPMEFSRMLRGQHSRERAMELLRMVELEQHAYKLPSAISGGQQQRVAIARALANDPVLIVADEPTGRLDSATTEMIFDIFVRLVQAGKTLVMVTHDLSLTARVPRVLYMADGEIRNGSTTA